MTRPVWTGCLLAALALSTPPGEAVQRAATGLPERLDRYVTDVVRLSRAERERLLNGSPVTKLLDADASKEVAVFGAIWIGAPMRRYVEAVQDIENLERGRAFTVTRRTSDPPRPDDFSELRLPPGDIEDLRTCRVGDCNVKLGARALERFRTEVEWQGPDPHASANALMRRLALRYVTGYLEGGNERLAIYRDHSRPTFVAQEFRAMIDGMPELTSYMPDVRRYLLEYPAATLPGSVSFLYWQEAVFGLKPTIRISHLTIREGAEDTVVASKMLYASHYFWTGVELRGLLPDPARGQGFWFVTVNRSRSDGLSGFRGLFVRRRVRGEVERGTRASLESTRARLERP